MSDFQISDHLLTKECDEIAAGIVEEQRDELAGDESLEDYRDEMSSCAHERVDGHSWVIYNHKALMICAHCNTDEGEAFLEDVGMPEGPDIYKLACLIAFGEMRARVEQAIDRLIENADEEEN